MYQPKRVAVIGGGLAGLTCAYSLHRRGMDTTVFEAGENPGGRVSGAPFLLAPDLFRNTFQLIRELGLAGDTVSISPEAGQVYKGRIYRHHVASATGLLKFKGLNIADKALLAKMGYLLARYGAQLDFHRPELGLAFDDENVAQFVKRELSQNILNYVAGPLISTLFFYGSHETSKLLYLILAKHMYNTRMSTLRGGLGKIADRMTDGLRVVRRRRIDDIAADGSLYVCDGHRYSDVVVAVPGDAVLAIKGLDAFLSSEDREFFRSCHYERVVSVIVETDRPLDGACYAVSIPRVENLTAATIAFYDFIDASQVSAGRGRLAITGGGPDVTPDSLLRDLAQLYGVQPKEWKTFEWSSGMPKFPPGRYRQIDAFNKRTRRPGLSFCGDYLMGPFVEAAITTGLSAAEAAF